MLEAITPHLGTQVTHQGRLQVLFSLQGGQRACTWLSGALGSPGGEHLLREASVTTNLSRCSNCSRLCWGRASSHCCFILLGFILSALTEPPPPALTLPPHQAWRQSWSFLSLGS